MIDFVRPGLLGPRNRFMKFFVNPIVAGQATNSSADEVKLMNQRSYVLHGLLSGTVNRKDISTLRAFLPPKHEYIISVRLSDRQKGSL